MHFGAFAVSPYAVLNALSGPETVTAYVPGLSHVYYARQASPRRFVIEYRNLRLAEGRTAVLQVLLYPSGVIQVQYLRVDEVDPTGFTMGITDGGAFPDGLIYDRMPAAGRVIELIYPAHPISPLPAEAERWAAPALAPGYIAARRAIAIGKDAGGREIVYIGPVRGGLLRSRESGGWTGLPVPLSDDQQHVTLSPEFASDRTLFVGGPRGLVRSTNGGDTWAHQWGITGGASALAFSPAYTTDRTILAAGEGLYISTDAGATWVFRSPVATGVWFVAPHFAADFATSNTLVVGATDGRLYRSTDAGVRWTSQPMPDVPRDLQLADDYALSHRIFALVQPGRLLQTTDEGKQWTSLMAAGYTEWFEASPHYSVDRTLYAGMEWGASPQMLRSTDGGASWRRFDQGLGGVPVSMTIDRATGRLHTLVKQLSNDANSLYVRDPGQGQWTLVVGSSTPPGLGNTAQMGGGLDAGGRTVLVAGQGRSTDGGRSWQSIAGALAGETLYNSVASPAFASDNTLLAMGLYALLRSTDGGQTWSKRMDVANLGSQVHGLAISPGFAADGTAFAAADKLYRTTNRGAAWQAIADFPTVNVYLSPSYPADRLVWAISAAGGGLRSTDGGATWYPFALPYNGFILSVSPTYATDHMLFFGNNATSDGGLWRSTDAGNSWQPVSSSLPRRYFVKDLLLSTDFAGDQRMAVLFASDPFESRDAGRTWQPISAGLITTYDYAGPHVYLPANDTLYLSGAAGLWARRMGFSKP